MQVKYGLTGWLILTVVVFGLALLHQSDAPVLFGRYSTSYGVQLGILAAAIALTGFLTALAWTGQLSRLNPLARYIEPLTRAPGIWIASAGIVASLLAFWLFMPGARGQPAILLFRVYIALTGLVALVLLLRQSDVAQRELSTRTELILAGLMILLVIAATALFIGHVPPTIVFDEAWLADWGHTMFVTGKPLVSMMPDQPPGYAALWSILMPVQGAWLNSFGMTLQAGRLFWLVLAWLSAPFVFLTARSFYGRSAAWLSVVIVLLVPIFHDYLRSDLFVATVLAMALYFMTSAGETGKLWRYFAAGFALAFAVEGHVLAVRFALTIGLWMAFEYAALLWQNRRFQFHAPFFAFAAGGITYAALYPFVHTVVWGLPVRELFDSGTRYYATDAAFGAGAGSGLVKWVSIMQEWLINYLSQSPVEFALFMAAIVFALWRRGNADKRLLIWLLVAQAFMLVLLPKFNRYYFIHHLPLLALLGGALLANIVDRGERQRLTPAQAILTGAIALLMVAQMHITRVDGQDIDRAIAIGYEANEIIPPEADRIIGNQYFYWGLKDRDFIALEDLIYYVPFEQRFDRLTELAPDGLVLVPGQDDPQTYAFEYIVEHGFIAARCFELDIYQRRVMLYLAPEFAPPEPVSCG